MKLSPYFRNALSGVLMLGILASACASPIETTPPPAPSTPSPENSPQPSASWDLVFNLSGGFRGYMRVINLSFLGTLSVTDEKTHKQASMQLDQEEMEKISQLVLTLEQSQPESKLPACADCINYGLDVRIDSRQIHALFNDINLPGTAYQPLIYELMKLQEEALSK